MTTQQLLEPLVKPLTLDPNEIGFYKREGYLPLPGLLDRATADEAREEVLEILRVGKAMDAAEVSGQGATKHALVQSSQYLPNSVMDRIVNAPGLQGIAEQLMGGPSSVYLPFTAVKSGGGGGRFSFHQDNQYTRITDGMLGINIWIALVQTTPENGCLQMCARSHLKGTLEADLIEGGHHRKMKIEPEDFLPLRMNPGDAVAFSRLTVHGSCSNQTNQARVAYAVQFFRDDALAIWDNQPPRALKGANRWPVGPVEKITPPDTKGRDGH